MGNLYTNQLTGKEAEKKLTIVYTNSLNGNIDYCKCKGDPKGGLVKRATEIKKIKKKYRNIFLFETGDFLSLEPDRILSKYIIRAYRYIGYDAFSIGDQEFTVGTKEFLKYIKSLPFVCNNILIRRGGWKRPFRRYRIISKYGIKVGVIGTISRNSFRYYPKKITSNIRTLDQLKEIKKDIRSIKKRGADLIILLSHSGFDIDEKLGRSLKDVGLIVGGHSQTLLKKPVKIGNTVIVQAGANGSRIGILEISVKEREVKILGHSFRMPDEYQPEDDSTIRDLINRYKEESGKELKNLRFK